jgi:hypothetical protein
MKVIDPKLFDVNHPSHWEVVEKHIGKSKNKIVIIKNWFVNPYELKLFAKSVDYVDTLQGQVTNLPGYLHLIYNYRKSLYGPVRYACNQYFNASEDLMRYPEETRFSFQMYDTNEKVRFMSLYPHSDYTRYASVMSFNEPDDYDSEVTNGTAFWRYRDTGEEYVTSERNYRTERIANKVNSLTTFDPSQVRLKEWERYHVEPHEFNSIIFYEGALWHSPYFDGSGWRTNRLTFNAFIR